MKRNRGAEDEDDDFPPTEHVDIVSPLMVSGVVDGEVVFNHGKFVMKCCCVRCNESLQRFIGLRVTLHNVKSNRRKKTLEITKETSVVVFLSKENLTEEDKEAQTVRLSKWSCLMCGFVRNYGSATVCFKCRANKQEGPTSRILWEHDVTKMTF